jgi:DNA mismatch repair protein MutS2
MQRIVEVTRERRTGLPGRSYTGRVDAHALVVLEFPAIAERLAEATATPQGEASARALLPSPDPDEVARRQALTAEAIALLDDADEPSLHGVVDVRESAAHAARGGMLAPASLAAIARSVEVAVAARSALHERADVAPLLLELAGVIDPGLTSLAETISRAVAEDGAELRDTASQRLRKLRSRLREGRHRVTEQLRRLARTPELREHLQEDFVTSRGGRPVLAVRASARSGVRGIVHDTSASGQTIFVEPFAVVELNNELAEAVAAERDEVERILRELSAAVGERADALHALVEATAAIDLAVARGAVSRAWRGAPVEVSDEVRLLAARHPLLDPAAAVPIDLDLGAARALVLSGPNTGGKTVALKTLGLAAALHQAGLRPPAEVAALPVFDDVLADIGDEQSIEMSLSTFSGHVRNLIAILDAATARSLVLVDELASGTDPIEGSALAQALLARLVAQARLTVVTTHYAELKEWASATDGVVNGATGLDPETYAPLFRVTLGRPGTSHALQTAERLGLDEEVVSDARARVAPERLRIAELLAEAEAAERKAAQRADDVERERVDAAGATANARERERELQEQIDAVRTSAARERQRAVAETEQELAAARAELRALRDEIRAARRRERERRRAEPAEATSAERERDRRLGAAAERVVRAERALGIDAALRVHGPLAPGDPVRAPDLGVRGTIAAIEGDEAEVVAPGGLRVRIPLQRLQPDPSTESQAEAKEPAVRFLAATRADVPDELDVRDRRAQEAREAVRAFVDEAALAGLQTVRVVHGRGTGAVRTAVREELRSHQLVATHEPDSADGATLVHLAN